ncbi:serine protease [Pseudoalteromonas luteoviolacea]|uniref:S1 family peptidase n=1 Tax=Pseudoalteromonas luteoviolacea TaxID=43657 RepID=UPI001F1C6873|nr:serine protease [Pseudoalteromonas luteoviolacea]MCF6442158.1 serine protease [Pseudoalteromonas luteoviolacea]
MRILALMIVFVALSGCEATRVNNVNSIKTKVKLNNTLSLPINADVAFHVDRSVPEDKVNFIGQLESAAELVTQEMFSSSKKLDSDVKFDYLIKLKATSDWDIVWGGWDSDFTIQIFSADGELIFDKASIAKASGSGGVYDFNAVFNSFAKETKTALINFVNTNEALLINPKRVSAQSKPVKYFFKDAEPVMSGTGFFINNRGVAVTAAHVIDECIFYETQEKGVKREVELIAQSNLLDLAVIQVKGIDSASVTILEEPNVTLGKQVFTTGFPLSGILSEYPSMTMGNISSLGGLKGAKGFFQFSAPIQPGNSGGAILDYKGNLVGVVSSSLNQSIMLKKSGTVAQNVNFGVDVELLKKFLTKQGVTYNQGKSETPFEQSSANAVESTIQLLCYK